VSIEDRLGLDFSRPILHMREYLTVLKGALTGAPVNFAGQMYKVNSQVNIPNVGAPPVIVAALGEQMLKLAGRLADGTSTWMTGPATLANTTVPTITKDAQEQ